MSDYEQLETVVRELGIKLNLMEGAEPPLDDQEESWRSNAYGYTAMLTYTPKGEKKARVLVTPFWSGSANAKYISGKFVPIKPTVAEVVFAIVNDSREYASFEAFCEEAEYDLDSRKAERLYQTLVETRRRALRVFGPETLARLVAAEY